MHGNGTHFEAINRGSEEGLYRSALTMVLTEMGLIRARRGLKAREEMPQSHKELPVNDLPSTIKISSNETSWTVEVEPKDAEGTRYVYDYSIGHVTVHQPEIEAAVVQKDSDGARQLEDLHKILMNFHDAGL